MRDAQLFFNQTTEASKMGEEVLCGEQVASLSMKLHIQ